ncbi:MAG TPA: hypothetical protein PKA90_10330 [Ignavibacteria bacterium]|nr:hypothetical protein [Ignavibacteria bacterium]
MKSSPSINIKLILGLSLISQKEFREFIFFSTSRYFSGQRNYDSILKLLKSLHKSKFRDHDNKSILDHLMSELKLNKKTLLSRMSEMYKIFEMFIVIRELKYKPNERNNILMSYYIGKNSGKLFNYVYNSSKVTQKKEKISSEKLKNEFIMYDLSSTSYFKLGKKKLFNEHFSLRSEFQIYAFITELFKSCIEILQQKFIEANRDIDLPELILNEMSLNKILDSIKRIDQNYYNYIFIIYKMYLSFKDFSEIDHFKEALKIQKKMKSSLSADENQYVYILFITYCINQTHFNKPEFYKYLFLIIKEKLNDGYYSELTENNFPINNFRDYVFIGLRVGESQWVRNFIKDYSSLLPSLYRKDDVLIAESLIALNEHKFEEALTFLNKVRKKNYLHYTDSSFYRLRAFYELRRFDDALNEIDKIRKYFNSNKEIPLIFLQKYSPYLEDINVLIKFSEGKIDKNDFCLYFERLEKGTSINWVSKEIKKILNKF